MTEKRSFWNLSHILDGQTIDELISELKNKVADYTKYKEKLDTISSAELLQIIKEKEAIVVLSTRIQGYLELRFNENTQDSEILAKMTHVEQISNELGNQMLFFPLWFMRIDKERADKFIADCPEYAYYLQEIRKKAPYTKDEETEKIINIKSLTGGGSTASLYEIFTASFHYSVAGKEVGREELMSKIYSLDPKERQLAYDEVLGKYGQESTILAEMYKNIVIDWFNEGVKIRGYKNASCPSPSDIPR